MPIHCLRFPLNQLSIIMCDSQEVRPDWLSLDDLIMEKIFEQLPLRDRFNASLVCTETSTCNKKVVELIEHFSMFIASGVPSMVHVL